MCFMMGCDLWSLGIWLPWQENLELAGGHGWTPEACIDMADHLHSLDLMVLDPTASEACEFRITRAGSVWCMIVSRTLMTAKF